MHQHEHQGGFTTGRDAMEAEPRTTRSDPMGEPVGSITRTNPLGASTQPSPHTCGAPAPALSFVRKTTKYWVKAVDVGEVKRIVGRHLPECQPEG